MTNSLSPGSNGWIKKYFDLAEKKSIALKRRIPQNIELSYYLHLEFVKSGIVYGYPTRMIFSKKIDCSKWTNDEKLKVLLFEALILIYQNRVGSVLENKSDFLKSLDRFYVHHKSRGVKKYFRRSSKHQNELNLERILNERMHVKPSLREWIYYHSSTNMLCFVDVILYQEFILNKNENALLNYPSMVETVLTAYQLSAGIDGIVDANEKNLFRYLLLSSQYGKRERKSLLNKLSGKLEMADLRLQGNNHHLYKRYIFDISVLTIYFKSDDAKPEETAYLLKLLNYLNLPEIEIEEAIIAVESFVLKNANEAEFLKNMHSIEKIYSGLIGRWVKIISRNKDKLTLELKESKELVSLIKKSASGSELNKAEKAKVKSQFLDIARSVPALAIFMLPGGAILMPLVLKIIPDLIPSAFRDNEVEDIDNEPKNLENLE